MYVLTWNQLATNLKTPEFLVTVFDHGWKNEKHVKYTSRILSKPRFDLWWGIKEANLTTGNYFISVQARKKGDTEWYTSSTGHFRIPVFLDSHRNFKPCEKPTLFIAKPSIFPELFLCTRGLGVWSNVPKRVRVQNDTDYVLKHGNREHVIKKQVQISAEGRTYYFGNKNLKGTTIFKLNPFEINLLSLAVDFTTIEISLFSKKYQEIVATYKLITQNNIDSEKKILSIKKARTNLLGLPDLDTYQYPAPVLYRRLNLTLKISNFR